VVQDVRCFPGHIACDCSSRSELVVPVFGLDQNVLGVIDMDSALPGRFDDADAEGLAKAAELLAPFLIALQ
jgi:L-methionine (R)-S-oxide reductase